MGSWPPAIKFDATKETTDRKFYIFTDVTHTHIHTHTQLAHNPAGVGDVHSAWQVWHLWHWAGSGGALGSRLAPLSPRLLVWQAWHLATSLMRGKGSTYVTVLALVARLGPRRLSLCMVLGDMTFTLRGRRGAWWDLHFAWQVWRLLRSLVWLWWLLSRALSHNSRTTLSHISFTQNFVLSHTHNFVTQNSSTQLCHRFLSHTILSHNPFTHTHTTLSHTHTTLSHTTLSHTQLCHIQLFHTQHLYIHKFTHTHTTLSHTALSPKLSCTISFPFCLSHLIFTSAWWSLEKLTCGVIRSFSFDPSHHAPINLYQSTSILMLHTLNLNLASVSFNILQASPLVNTSPAGCHGIPVFKTDPAMASFWGKYARKPKGCKDGRFCTRCHICHWHRPVGWMVKFFSQRCWICKVTSAYSARHLGFTRFVFKQTAKTVLTLQEKSDLH